MAGLCVNMHSRPDPDFEEFALDSIRLSNEEKSPTLLDAKSGEPWSEMDISDLTNEIAHDRTMAEIASFLCRDEDEVRQKAKELGLVEQHARVSPPLPRARRARESDFAICNGFRLRAQAKPRSHGSFKGSRSRRLAAQNAHTVFSSARERSQNPRLRHAPRGPHRVRLRRRRCIAKRHPARCHHRQDV